jgi:3-methyl-2-oxobutanoate hydroxymethyltransferase
MAITPQTLIQWKQQQRPIVTLTAWDTPIARILDDAGIDVILVGDSLAMVALGYTATLPVTLEAMIHHASAVCRGVKRALVVCDLPFLSYQESTRQAIRSAGRVLKESGARGVKIEGGYPAMIETIARLTEMGIPVMGHIGLTPQSVYRLGYRQQGQTEAEADRLLSEALALQDAGVFSIVLEHIPAALAARITEKLSVPTIGIGAGPDCDGQVLVTADILGLSTKSPPFSRKYTDLQEIITTAAREYALDVKERRFPEE